MIRVLLTSTFLRAWFSPGALLTLALAALLSSVGCSGGPSEPLPATFPVTGKVVFKEGEPCTGGAIQFQSEVDPAITALGEIEPDGSFSLFTHLDGNRLPGAIEGPHEVTVMPPSSESQMAMPITLAAPYSVQPKENDFTVTIDRSGF